MYADAEGLSEPTPKQCLRFSFMQLPEESSPTLTTSLKDWRLVRVKSVLGLRK
jgi:hypothetical protein